MDLQPTLKKFGLNDKEASVYLAALELGESSMTELSKKSALKRPTTYLVAQELELLGLLSETKKGKRKLYSAAHPKRFFEIARFREQQIQEILPELVAFFNAPKDKPKIQVFEGKDGINLVYRELYQSLNNKEEALWFTNIGALKKFMPEALTSYKKMLQQLNNPKIRELNYGDDAGKQWMEEMKKIIGKNHVIKILAPDFSFGYSDNLIFGNKLVIFSLSHDVFVTVIESIEVTKTFRALFEWAWKQGITNVETK